MRSNWYSIFPIICTVRVVCGSAIIFGTVEQINRMREKGLFADAILLGALFIIGFYHLALFFNRRQELPVLHFGLFCLMIAARVPFTGEFFLTQLFPDFPLSLQLRLEYTTVYITPVFIISFIAYSYAERSRKFILYYSRIIALILPRCWCCRRLCSPASSCFMTYFS